MTINFSISTIIFRNFNNNDLKKAISFILNKSDMNLELWSGHFKKLNKKILKSIKSRILSVSIYENFSEKDCKNLQTQIAFLKKNKFSTPLKVRVFLGNKSSHILSDKEKYQTIERFQFYNQMLMDEGYHLLLETHQGTMLDEEKSVLTFLKSGLPDIRLLLDIHNLCILKPISTNIIKQLVPYVSEIHVKNTERLQSVKEEFPLEAGKINIKNSHLEKGFVDWNRYFHVLKKNNFSGDIVLEWFSKISVKNLLKQYQIMKLMYENA